MDVGAESGFDAIWALEPPLPRSPWTGIRAAYNRTRVRLSELRQHLGGYEELDAAIVATGSFGRGEVTDGSDLDWFLLVDSPSDPAHRTAVTDIGKRLADCPEQTPGRTGVFGGLVSSHDLVHYIAGTDDTNENLTRRILLLVESVALTRDDIRKRVIRNVLNRYVVHDRSLPPEHPAKVHRVPHFLLNDIVRYWRTMTSDFASKMFERDQEGWGLRNIKLRFSRKLLFVSGLLTCFAPSIWPDELSKQLEDAKSTENALTLLSAHIADQTDEPPLAKLARAYSDSPETGRNVFGAYDAFLTAVSCDSTRSTLATLEPNQATTNDAYRALREHSHTFRDGIEALFFNEHKCLANLIRRYGVF